MHEFYCITKGGDEKKLVEINQSNETKQSIR